MRERLEVSALALGTVERRRVGMRNLFALVCEKTWESQYLKEGNSKGR
jgi:hypothetical protein